MNYFWQTLAVLNPFRRIDQHVMDDADLAGPMLFILFYIEIVFLYPLAIVLEQLGWFGLTEFLVFVAILAVAYIYIWRKGALEWR